MKTIVIGGGPAGMIAAVTTAEQGNSVTILEKMEDLGKKLLITGKGRCNITNSAEMEDFMKNIPENAKFLYSSFNQYTNQDIINFLNKQGVATKVERGGRVFPVSDRAEDVLNAFKRKLKELNVEIKTNFEVTQILTEGSTAIGIEGKYKGKTERMLANKVILTTGGKSYPVTGSTGDGYKITEKLGHTITPLKPSLVPLICEEDSKKICQDMQGLSLRNVAIKVKHENKIIYEDFGEMLFTHYGLSGPIILSASAILIRYKNIEKLLKSNKIKIFIDLKPALDEEKLDNRILRDFEELRNKQFKNSLEKLLPRKMINTIIEIIGINPEKRINEITKEERKKLVKILKNFELNINGFRKIEEAIITKGGINVKEINPRTMESKIIKGLYFAGEIIDLDAFTGGFNLQIAWSTGYVAGLNQ
jgi:predicted Rossmann fold flavoprotein